MMHREMIDRQTDCLGGRPHWVCFFLQGSPKAQSRYMRVLSKEAGPGQQPAELRIPEIKQLGNERCWGFCCLSKYLKTASYFRKMSSRPEVARWCAWPDFLSMTALLRPLPERRIFSTRPLIWMCTPIGSHPHTPGTFPSGPHSHAGFTPSPVLTRTVAAASLLLNAAAARLRQAWSSPGASAQLGGWLAVVPAAPLGGGSGNVLTR